MLTPTKITLKNYCQHISLSIDLSAPLHILIGANGRGKSNILHAINFALTGQATPGAKKIEDDIFDSSDFATVSLDFETSNGAHGNITRTIRRKAGTSAILRIDGLAAPIEGVEDCAEKLREMLGADLKAVMSTVIVGQHDIGALLFDGSPGKRLANLQNLLLGDIFTRAAESISAEKSKLYIDQNVQSTVKTLKKCLSEQEKNLKSLTSQRDTLLRTLDSQKLKNLREKAERIKKYDALRTTYLGVQATIQRCAEGLANVEKQISELGTMCNLAELNGKFTKLSGLKSAWDAYNKHTEHKNEILAKIGELAKRIEALGKKQEDFEKLTKTKAVLKEVLEYTALQEKIIKCGEDLVKAQQSLEKAEASRKLISDMRTKNLKEFQEIAGKASILKVFLEQGSQLSECPICGSALNPEQKAQLGSLAHELDAKAKNIENDNKQHANAECAALGSVEAAKQSIAALKILLTEARETIAKLQNHSEYTKETAEAKLKELEQMPEDPTPELTAARAQNAVFATQLAELSKIDMEKPKEEFSLPEYTAAAEALKKGTEMQAKHMALITQKAQFDGQISVSKKTMDAVKAEAAEAKLPKLDAEATFALNAEEQQYLKEADEKQAKLEETEKNKLVAETYISSLKESIANAEHAVAGAESTQAYEKYLTTLAATLKTLPNTILQHTLADLCRAMQEIIASFHFYQPFGVMINNKLEFVMRYPNGATRPIAKASGGEQIILGIAFRIAAHRKFSPLNWLVIDEPTNHLTEENIRVLQQVIQHLRGNLGEYGINKLIIATHCPTLINSAANIINI